MADFPLKLKLVSRDEGMATLAAGDGFEFSVPSDIIPSHISQGTNFDCPVSAISQHLDQEAGLGLINGSLLFID